MTSLALFLPSWLDCPQRAIEAAQTAERAGLDGVFLESSGDNLTMSATLLERTSTIPVGTAISNIYMRHPREMAFAVTLLEALHPGRFTLGLGVANPSVYTEHGLITGKPLGDMRRYVEAIHEYAGERPLPRIILAALRRRMTGLAAEIGDGVVWANAPLSRMPYSIAQLGSSIPDDFWIANSLPACITDDRAQGDAAMREYLLFYLKLQGYQRFWAEAGYQDEVAAGMAALEAGDEQAAIQAISDEMIEDIAAVGSPEQVRARVATWHAAGVERIIIDPISAGDDPFECAEAVIAMVASS